MKPFTTLAGDNWWRAIGAIWALFGVLAAITGSLFGLIAGVAGAAMFFILPGLLDSTFGLGWTGAANKLDDFIALTAIWDAEEQKLVPLVPDTIRMQWYVDLMDARPSRRQYEQRMLDMTRELAQMKDPSKEKIAELYRKYH